VLDIGSDLFVHDLVDAKRLDAPFKKLEVTDIQNLAYADNQFATITCMNTLYHAPDQVKALQEMGRVLAPGGTLYFDVIRPGFVDLIPLRKMLHAAGFTVAAEEMQKSLIKPQAELPVAELLADFEVDIVPTMSMELFNIAYSLHALDWTLPYTEPTAERKAQTLRFLRTVIAPLLAQDRQLAARGSAFLFVKAMKHGTLHTAEAPAHRCPKCFGPLSRLSCKPCTVTYPEIEGIPLLATQYLEPFATLAFRRTPERKVRVS
jgi:SAM-dependent methyltransferase